MKKVLCIETSTTDCPCGCNQKVPPVICGNEYNVVEEFERFGEIYYSLIELGNTYAYSRHYFIDAEETEIEEKELAEVETA